MWSEVQITPPSAADVNAAMNGRRIVGGTFEMPGGCSFNWT